MDVISHSPQLKSIYLSRWNGLNEDQMLGGGGDVIQLPHLQVLHCDSIPPSIQYVLARRLVVPVCAKIVLKFGQEVQMNPLRHATAGVGARVRELIDAEGSAKIEFRPPATLRLTSPRIEASDAVAVEMEFMASDDTEIPLLDWISEDLLEEAAVSIQLNRTVASRTLDRAGGASRLASPAVYFAELAKPIVVHDGVKWPLLELVDLDLRSATITIKEFKEFVWDRWGICDPAHAKMEARLKIMERPETLNALTLPHNLIGKVAKAERHALGQCSCGDARESRA
ncbi:hypothetical protein FRB90_002494 [Tulasnella sp. 427]|nr:hypothetical protein FRB90_002494 [Tulasnella sp. 427]